MEKKLAAKDPTPYSSRNIRAAAEFSSKRYAEKGLYLGMVSDLLIDQTDVDRYLKGLRNQSGDAQSLGIHEMRLGDPTKYEGLGPYEGFHRSFQRFIRFNPASSYAGYLIPGDDSLKTRLRMGRTKTPGFIHPPDHVEVILTPGVAGALRILNMALLLPPCHHNPDPLVMDELERRLVNNSLSADDVSYLLAFVRTLRQEVSPDNVVIPKWTYVSHMAEASLAHADFKLCNITADGQVDVDDLNKVIDQHTRAVLFATVGNPLTVAMKPDIFDSILQTVDGKMAEYGHPIAVLADIIYEQYRRDRSSRIDPIQRTLKMGIKVPVMEMSSFSKMLAIPGERVGFIRVLWDPDLFPSERRDFFKALKNVTGPTLNYVACSVQRALGTLYTAIRSKLPVEEELAPLAAVLTALSDLSESKEMAITFGDTQLFFREKEIREREVVPKNVKAALAEMGIERGYFSARKVANKTRKIAYKQLKRYDVDLDSDMVLEIGKVLEAAGFITSITKDEVTFFKLTKQAPKLERDQNGKLKLYRISENSAWREVAEKCGVGTEDVLYQDHKKMMRDTVFDRVRYFANGIDNMAREGIGVYLHPSYYDEKGELDHSRFNAFYVLWGFEKLRRYIPNGPSQARVLAEKCVEMRRPIIACVPGENFVPSEMRTDETSIIRAVALPPISELDAILQTIRLVARELENSP
ncbi:MAG: aminotransferase class I/II-fold pyridoxal phosphate-dependent enzyme [Candidatus Micrarchaeia archaeon]